MSYASESAANGTSPSVIPSLKNVKEDLRALKTDLDEVGHEAIREGKKRLEEAGSQVHDKIDSLKEAGSDELSALTSYISKNPGKAVLGAFAIGMVCNMLCNGRR